MLSDIFFSPIMGILLVGNLILGIYLVSALLFARRDPLYTFLWSIMILALPLAGLIVYGLHRRMV